MKRRSIAQIVATVWVLLLAPVVLGKKGTAHGSGAPTVDAQTSKATALALFHAGKLAEAREAADKAIAASPAWPEPYFLRSQIEEAQAGPEASVEALNKPPLPDHDYAAIAARLAASAADLEQFVTLSGEVLGRQVLMDKAADLRVRQVAAEAVAKSVQSQKDRAQQQVEEEEQKKQAAVAAGKQAEEQQAALAASQKSWDDTAAVQKAADDAHRQAEQAARAQATQDLLRREHEAKEAQAKKEWDDQREWTASWRHVGYRLAIAGLIFGAGSGVAAYLSSQTNSKIEKGGFSNAADIVSVSKQGQTENVIAEAAGGVGGVLVLASLPFIFANGDPGDFPGLKTDVNAKPSLPVSFGIVPGSHRAVAVATFTFP